MARKPTYEELEQKVKGLEKEVFRLKKSEVTLRESEERLKILFEYAPDAYYLTDLKGFFIDGNKAAEEMIGYNREELIGKSFLKLSLLPPEQIPKAAKHLAKNAIGLPSGPDEFTIIKKDNNQVAVKIRTYPVKIKGQPLVLGIARDISERNRTEEALQESEEKYGQLFQTITDAIMLFDAETRKFIDVNNAASNLYGYNREDFLKLRHQDITAEIEKSDASIRQTLEGKLTRIPVRYHKKKDGTIFPVEISASMFTLKNRKVLCGAIRDITERMQQEEALRRFQNELEQRVKDSTSELKAANEKLKHEIEDRKRVEESLIESEAKWRSLVEHATDIIFTVNDQGRILFINHPPEGLTSEAAIGTIPLDYVAAEHRELVEQTIQKVFQTGNPGEYEIKSRGPLDTFSWYSTHLSPIKLNGEINAVLLITRDITDRKRIEDEIRRNREELAHVMRVATLGELSASLAHEINQPLTAILSNAQAAQRFLNSDKPDLEEVRDILADIILDDKRAGEVIRRLRALFRNAELEKKGLDVNRLIDDTLAIIKSETIMRNVSIKMESNKILHPVIGDQIQLQQVILNLVMNASEAMAALEGDSRKVIITLEREDEKSVKITIRDFGIGIDENKIDRIFEPFYTTKREGIGMGLSISKSIIEAHGGRLWAENNPDGGATFHFTLPIFGDFSA